MDVVLAIGLALAAGVMSWTGCGVAMRVLRARAILDHPNERSSHSVSTPRGGGVAVMAVIAVGWAIVLKHVPDVSGAATLVLIWAVVLAAMSWIDDRRGLGPLPRFAGQALAVAAVLALAPPAPVFQEWLPIGLDRALTALAWLWFLNLFNFMDGIDGITGVETASVAGGVALLAVMLGIGDGRAGLAVVMAAAALGFLVWNWHPARLFLGDVGSVPLGFALGWLLLDLAGRGWWAAALILPAYYLADATLTLLKRLARGERVWRAHRSHFYQRAVQAGLSHAQVSRRILILNIGLVAMAALSTIGVSGTVVALAISAVSVFLVMWYFHRAAPKPDVGVSTPAN